MSDLLLELFSEEIPAGMQARAGEDLQRLVCDGLKEAGLEFKTARNFPGARRLTLVIDGLADKSPDVSDERKGPRVGSPDKAIEGFLRGAGLKSVDEAEIVTDEKKGDFYVARIERQGRATSDIIAELIPAVIRQFPWPKSQRWGSGKLRWVRPLHSILCLLGGSVVPFDVDGISSGNETRGHRFMSSGALAVKDFSDYEKKLRDAFVIQSAEERQKIILEGARAAAKKAKLELVEDDALLAEAAGLVEWPVVLMGAFDEAFLDVPPEVIITAIRKHQKCFSLRDGKSGKLANKFVLVSNLIAEDGGKAIIAGNERVVRARLSDAKFFWDQDRKVKLKDRLPELENIIFHEKLGTQAERVERVKVLAGELAKVIGADPGKAIRAAELCKADLVTDMVGEFPDLQGLMGKYYAEQQEEPPEVAAAIEEHYRPQGPNDAVPTNPVSIAVALADKLDTLVGFWAIDEKPTGSKDPYALRRAALGFIRIALENEITLSVSELILTFLHQHVLQTDTDFRETFNYYRNDFEATEDDFERFIGGGPWVWIWSSDAGRESVKKIKEVLFERSRSEGEIHSGMAEELDAQSDELSERFKPLQNLIHWSQIANSASSSGQKVDVSDDFNAAVENFRLVSTEFIQDLLSFFHDRLKVYLRDRGARHDLIDAVISPEEDDLLMIVSRVDALGKFLDTDDGANLLAGVKRAANILRIEEKKDGTTFTGEPDAKLLQQDEEKALGKAITEATKTAQAAVEKEDFEGAMAAMAKLRSPVDAFFDNVTVNADDPKLRENRLKLLNQIREATRAVADFSKIEG